MVIKHLLALNHFGQENYQKNVGLYCMFHLNLISLTNFRGDSTLYKNNVQYFHPH
jgi:hypothetical protein